MGEYKNIFANKDIKRFFILVLFAVILYAVSSMINLILFTFIFAFLMDRFVELFSKRLPIKRSIIAIALYIIVIGALVYGISAYLPVFIEEIKQLVRNIIRFYMRPNDNPVINYMIETISRYQVLNYLEQGFSFVLGYFTNIGKLGLQLFLAIILSLFYLLEKDRLKQFSHKFNESKIAPIYRELSYFGSKFAGTFGKVIEAQFIIALVNCGLTTISLYFLGFPQLFGIAMMIFILGLIPVAGVIISLIPLCIIAFSIGGIAKVVTVIIIVMVVHAIEAYILNPKLMSSKTDLPVFFTFIVLIFSEHFFGVWGLIVGIPIFIFLLDILEVKDKNRI
ncbi:MULTISPECIES: AI-2E family transporter [Bacillaceae]|uniref:AI-2E family transporter n=1 Tax=Bacillaceae TaxID=186817 RepID=UPI001E3B018C|nr:MULTISPECIES: AI-2E family transporter [Bacillaceae]MCE4050275.1 AI-2E family transporter [Bacillus sp. Au-Bac7]MCM3029510.1 AI-2E family transporter [Niallia sp. MER 6]MDL0435184.1 AI-2E family transporter [Niallia sp. SS-2023]UPO87050.1 AI-2E family transporter [Niallia sp. Man26]